MTDDRLIAAARADADPGHALLSLLDERADCYRGRTVASSNLLRARVLAELGHAGLPTAGLPFVLEELESGLDPSCIAAAGRALRGADAPLPDEAGTLLIAAIERLRGRDDAVRFVVDGPTAIEDLAATIEHLGPAVAFARPALAALVVQHGCCFGAPVHARLDAALDALAEAPRSSCCGSTVTVEDLPAAVSMDDIAAVVLEDQDGHRATFAERFRGRPTAVSFFYTRCTNPQRCSLTVTRLADLARLVEEADLDLGVAGISYDPRHDRPDRLRQYGVDRGMVFSDRCSLLRTPGPVEPLVDTIGLGVGFGPVTVNQHRLDLVVFDAELRVRRHRARRLWQVENTLAELLVAGAATG